jgi:hypothetical protein
VTSALGTVSCETGQPFMQSAFSDATLAALKTLGHFSNVATAALACSTTTIGSVQGVIVDPDGQAVRRRRSASRRYRDHTAAAPGQVMLVD